MGNHRSLRDDGRRVEGENESAWSQWVIHHLNSDTHNKTLQAHSSFYLCLACVAEFEKIKQTTAHCKHCKQGGASGEDAGMPAQHAHCAVCSDHKQGKQTRCVGLPPTVGASTRSHARCGICQQEFTEAGAVDTKLLSSRNRLELLAEHGLFAAKGVRCCASHLDKSGRLQAGLELPDALNVANGEQYISVAEAEILVAELLTALVGERKSSARLDPGSDLDGSDGNLADEEYQVWTGWTKDVFDKMHTLLHNTSNMRSSKRRSIRQALFIFWTKLKVDCSFVHLASLMGLHHIVAKSTAHCTMADAFASVQSSLTEHFVSDYLGLDHLTRDQMLEHHTVFSSAFCGADHLVLIFDGTYFYATKSGQYRLLRMQWSGQKKRPLSKMMSIVLPDGYVLDTIGPFAADVKNTDADILKYCIREDEELCELLQDEDVLVLDRGFDRARTELREKNTTWRIMMPAFRGRKATENVVTPSKPAASAKVAPPVKIARQRIEPGIKLLVPSLWWGNAYAKSKWSNTATAWKEGVEECKIVEKMTQHGKQGWQILSVEDQKAHFMLESAVFEYMVQETQPKVLHTCIQSYIHACIHSHETHLGEEDCSCIQKA
jgi:hypothetical protein